LKISALVRSKIGEHIKGNEKEPSWEKEIRSYVEEELFKD